MCFSCAEVVVTSFCVYALVMQGSISAGEMDTQLPGFTLEWAAFWSGLMSSNNWFYCVVVCVGVWWEVIFMKWLRQFLAYVNERILYSCSFR